MNEQIFEESTLRVRWAFNFMAWQPDEEEWFLANSVLDEEERTRIGKFKRPLNTGALVGRFNPDAKASCAGRLLLLLMFENLFGISWKEVTFGRTKEGKPILLKVKGRDWNKSGEESGKKELKMKPNESHEEEKSYLLEKYPRFNFNLSHHGDWVVLASEPHDLIGLDVMKKEHPARTTITDFFFTMRECFTEKEWQKIKSPNKPEDQLSLFYIFWTLKESYIKAIGIGLGFQLQTAEFDFNQTRMTATLKVNGIAQNKWDFFIEDGSFSADHVVSVALGTFEDAIESYKQSFSPIDPNNSSKTNTTAKPTQNNNNTISTLSISLYQFRSPQKTTGKVNTKTTTPSSMRSS